MNVNFGGKEYEIIFGSDVVRDGVFLELREHAGESVEVLLEAFWSDVDQGFTFYAFREALPFNLVELFVAEARRRLPLPGQESQV